MSNARFSSSTELRASTKTRRRPAPPLREMSCVSIAMQMAIPGNDGTSSHPLGYHQQCRKRLSRPERPVRRTRPVSRPRHRRGYLPKARDRGGNSGSVPEQKILLYQCVKWWRREKDSNPQYPNASPAQPHEFIIRLAILTESGYQRPRLKSPIFSARYEWAVDYLAPKCQGAAAGSAPACVGPPDRPAVAPQIFWHNVRSACSPRHARPRFEVKRSDRRPRFSVPDTHAAAKSP